MPHFECAACGAGLYSAAKPENLIDDSCPKCGFRVEPAGEFPEIVIFENTLADRMGHLIARREVVRAQVRVEAER